MNTLRLNPGIHRVRLASPPAAHDEEEPQHRIVETFNLSVVARTDATAVAVFAVGGCRPAAADHRALTSERIREWVARMEAR